MEPDFTMHTNNSLAVTCIGVFFLSKEFNDDQWLAVGDSAGGLSLWSVRKRRLQRPTWLGHPPGPVVNVCQVEDTEKGCLLSAGRDGYLRLWSGLLDEDNVEPLCLNIWLCSNLTFCRFTAWSCCGIWKCAFVSANEMTVQVCCLSQTNSADIFVPLTQVKNSRGMVMTLTGFDAYVLIGFESGHVELWHIEFDGKVDCCSNLKMFNETVMCLDYHSGVNRGVAGSVEKELIFFEITDAKHLSELRRVSAPNAGFAFATWRQDGRLVAVGGWDGRLRLFSRKGRSLAVLQMHKATLSALAFSERDRRLFSGARDGLLCVWTVYSGVV